MADKRGVHTAVYLPAHAKATPRKFLLRIVTIVISHGGWLTDSRVSSYTRMRNHYTCTHLHYIVIAQQQKYRGTVTYHLREPHITNQCHSTHHADALGARVRLDGGVPRDGATLEDTGDLLVKDAACTFAERAARARRRVDVLVLAVQHRARVLVARHRAVLLRSMRPNNKQCYAFCGVDPLCTCT